MGDQWEPSSAPGTAMSWHRPQALITIGLILYAVAIMLFAYAPLLPPPNSLLPVEIMIVVLSALALVGLVGRLVKHRWPLWKYAYLVVGGVGTLTLLGFVAGEQNAPVWFRLVISMFILSGVVVGFGAHLQYGGDHEP